MHGKYIDKEHFFRVTEIANGSHLLSQLAQTNISSLSPATRKDLMRALVVIGSATGDEETHRRLHDAVRLVLGIARRVLIVCADTKTTIGALHVTGAAK